MFQNDQQSGTKARRIGSPKKLVILLTSLALLILIAIGGTIAYIYTHTDPVINTFEPSEVDVTINETFDEQIKENVSVSNTGEVPVYVRAMLVINWVDADGNIVLTVPEGYTYSTAGLPGADWVEGSDGYYYYKSPVAKDGKTSDLFTECKAETPENPEYSLLVDVLAEVIQADPTDAVKEAWGVTVDANGNISK